MALINCPECGSSLTQEMIDVNMCWECGHVLDESQMITDDGDIEELEGQDYIYEYIKECPVCGKKHKVNAKECTCCGCNFINKPQLDYKEIAKLYNERLEQYKKNALYEYDVVVIPNKATGEINVETIRRVIQEHAVQSWRLITMYSNEIGKNAIIGINATASEDILVFERCIKEAE